MKHQLQVQLDNSEGALRRVLGTVERRGFAITGCRSSANDSGHSDLCLTVRGARHPDILCRQLERLLDVKRASMIAARPSGRFPNGATLTCRNAATHHSTRLLVRYGELYI